MLLRPVSRRFFAARQPLRGLCHLVAVLLAACVPALASAETVYKSVDKDGKTTYSSRPPAAAKTVELDIDPNRNVIPSDKSPATLELEQQQRYDAAAPDGADDDAGAALNYQQRVAEAEAELRAEEEALQQGLVAQPGDFLGKRDGGTRQTEQRLDRINGLQENVDRAREHLEAVRAKRY